MFISFGNVTYFAIMTIHRKRKQTKKKSKFPDHSGDGKITKKDILMAKGIIPKKKKKGKK